MAGSDRALRQMVAQLSELPPDDYEAVLQSLEERQRGRIRELLTELDGSASPLAQTPAAARFDAKAMPAGLSPWLLERLGVPPEDGTALPGAGAMTDYATAALKACAAELDPAPPEPDATGSIVGRLRRRLGAGLDKRMVGA